MSTTTTPNQLQVQRVPVRFEGCDQWVITRPFNPGGQTRIRHVVDRVGRLSDTEVDVVLAEVLAKFHHRHKNIEAVFEEHFLSAISLVGDDAHLSKPRRLLIGSYYTMEYSIASAALFNPSIVEHPNQDGVPAGGKRFIMSLRATGEGHVSSLIFRTGTIQPDHSITFDAPGRFPRRARQSPDRIYLKALFRRKLREMAINQVAVDAVMNQLSDRFTFEELEHTVTDINRTGPRTLRLEETTEGIRWLARENYRLRLPDDADISEVVIFPQSDNETRGIEDLRLVRFQEEDGAVTYYGTYSACNGYRVLPQLMETTDLHHIQIHTMNGACVQNKGMALFPRRINGHYVMCSRIDGENLYIMYSDIVQFWETAELLRSPKHPWEFMQMGNCGSPLETPAGWILLTHGVGPMRSYSIGAMLLDRNDPLKVIGHLDEPLIMPTEEEREGYTPNVVYTCGAMIHGENLFIPYAMSDKATGFAFVGLENLLERLVA